MADVIIAVTAAHIAAGSPNGACDCPVWHALRAAFPALARERDSMAVGPRDVGIIADAGACELYLPAVATDAIGRFDREHAMKPFSFTLAVPDWLAALYQPAVAGA